MVVFRFVLDLRYTKTRCKVVKLVNEVRVEMTERKSGTVKWFDNAKGYGFIVSPEGEDVFVHYRVIVGEGYRSLAEGQKVEFVASRGEKGWQASEVVVEH